MKIIISPAKELKLDRPGVKAGTYPDLSFKIMAYLQSLTPSDLQKTLKISDQLLEDNLAFIEGFKGQTCYPAIHLYNGLVYRQLDRQNLTPEDDQYLQDHLLILSALYGPISPDTGIKPYRLDMNMSVKIEGKTLKSHWRPIYNQAIDSDPVIINLASQEFASLFDRNQFQIIDFDFYQEGKQHATISKKARGQVLKAMIANKINRPEGIKGLNADGFRFDSQRSTSHHYVFVK